MKHLEHIIPCLVLVFLLGCGGSKIQREPTRSPAVSGQAEQNPVESPETSDRSDLHSRPEDGLFPEEPFSLGWVDLEDSTAAQTDLPDLSDSLAAATEARLPSIEELFDYPVVINRRVLTWIDAYRGRVRTSFEASLQRSGRYLPMARTIFAEEGVPKDLTFLAHVESGFRTTARSNKSACGLWQFMSGTAKLYGLRCDDLVDERRDPEKSTRAAAQHLRGLYEKYGDWNLVLAAYNAGSGKVDRAIRRSGSNDFWKIAGTRYLRRETRNFVPAILAATILAKSPGAYGLKEETDPPLTYDTLSVRVATDLRVIAKAAGLDEGALATLNPALLYGQTPPRGRYVVRLPVGSRETVRTALASIPPEARLLFHRHTVRKGDTLYDLAREYHTTVGAIQQENGLGRKTLIRVGKVLRIPNRPPKSYASSDRSRGTIQLAEATDPHPAKVEDEALGRVSSTAHVVEEARDALAGQESHPRIHVVQRGDTLGRIARLYDVPLSRLYRWNHLTSKSILRPGQEIITGE